MVIGTRSWVMVAISNLDPNLVAVFMAATMVNGIHGGGVIIELLHYSYGLTNK